MSKSLPFSQQKLAEIIRQYPTPFHLYDETGIKKTAKALNAAYEWSPGYKNYFAVKATPNPYILDILQDEGMGADASSLPELILVEKVGLKAEEIMFSSNNTAAAEYRKAYELGAIINLDDFNQIDALEKALDGKFPELISFRYNPGPDFITAKDNTIGSPSDAKFGVATNQLLEAYRVSQTKGAKRFGLHTMVATNEKNAGVHIEIAEMLFKLAVKLHKALDIKVEFINLGGGLGVPYRPDDKPLDLQALQKGLKAKYQEIIVKAKLDPIKVVTENGRFILASNGYLVAKVNSTKQTYHNYVGLDATMADLMRPGMYDTYHHISIPGKENSPTIPQRLTGSLCENNDHFTGSKDRLLPQLKIGDIVVIHEAGAHGHAMGFNYNGKLRHAELLLKEDGSVQQIRRAETVDDYFATLSYPGL